MRHRKKNAARYAIICTAILAGLIGLVLFLSPVDNGNGAEEFHFPQRTGQPYHVHADFLVVINSKELNFSLPEYDVAHPAIHLHLRNYKGGKVLHIESRAASLDDFFSSLNMIFTEDCFVAGSEYCNNETHALRFFVNGVANERFERYLPKDLDRILIIYDNETEAETKLWIDAVSSAACIFSLRCEPPEEAENKVIYN